MTFSTVPTKDHYAHFILDFVLPVWTWLYQQELHERRDFTVYFSDASVEYFRPILNSFFTCRMNHVSQIYDYENAQKVMLMGMVGQVRKDMGNIPLECYIGSRLKFIAALQSYTFNKLGVWPSEKADKLLFVRRETTGKDRGADRRGTSNEEQLAGVLREVAEEKKLIFQEAFLAGMRFKEQVQLFADSKAVVAQHGAALVNLLWMRKGSLLLEYHWNSNEAYRKREMCAFFRQPKHIHIEGGRVGSSMVEAPVAKIAYSLRDKL